MLLKLTDNEILKYKNEPVKGFHIWAGGFDHFIITDRKRVSSKLVTFLLGCTPKNIQYYIKGLQPATMVLKPFNNTYDINISGNGFGGCGSLITDKKTIVYREV